MQDWNVSRAAFLGGLSPWLVRGHLLPESSHGLPSVCNNTPHFADEEIKIQRLVNALSKSTQAIGAEANFNPGPT